MDRTTVTFRISNRLRDELDALAQSMERDRSFVLNEAVAAYLDTHRWQIAHIEEGIRQADAGDFATDDEVAETFARWRR
jgi:predicted transcriptional regulator